MIFIEVTHIDGQKICLNVAELESISRSITNEFTQAVFSQSHVKVKETPAEIDRLIRKAQWEEWNTQARTNQYWLNIDVDDEMMTNKRNNYCRERSET